MHRKCGNCKNWIKLHAMKGRGLCEFLDIGWISPDSKPERNNCYKSIKYVRNMAKIKELYY